MPFKLLIYKLIKDLVLCNYEICYNELSAYFISNLLLLEILLIGTTRKTPYGEKPNRPTDFGCYIDLTGFVISEYLQAYCTILTKTDLQQVYG